MKKILISGLLLLTCSTGFANYTPCHTSDSLQTFCNCVVTNCKASGRLPPASCATRSFKPVIQHTGVSTTCQMQHDAPYDECMTATQYFVDHC